MKKIFISLFSVGVILGLMASCGESYKPMTTEQLEAKVDSLYQAKAVELTATMKAQCDGELESNVKARMEELKSK